MIRNILIIIVLLGIAGGAIYFLFFNKPKGEKVEFTGSIESSFGEMNEYVNKQAQFSIKYPGTWSFEVKEFEEGDETKGVRLRGKTGYVDLYWSQEHDKGGCSHRFSRLPITGGEIEVCNFKQDDNSEIWNQIVKDRGELIFWANAYAASPAAQTRQSILDVFSTLKFL